MWKKMCLFSSDASKLPQNLTFELSHLQYSTSCISVTVYISMLIVCRGQAWHCLPSTQYVYSMYVFGLCVLILGVENTRKYYVHITILTEQRETYVCSGHRVRICKVLCLNIKQSAVQVLDAISRLKRNRQIRSTIPLSSHMLSSECEVCYNLSTIRIIESLHVQSQTNFISMILYALEHL